MSEVIVVKIGGSTLGQHDTTLADVAGLRRRGEAVVIVHGGGAAISDWLQRLGVPTKFERGLRVTDAASLDVVVAVLAGLVNKQLMASLAALGVGAVGLSGADGGMLRAKIKDEALGLVGDIADVDASPLVRVLLAGGVPVVASLGMQWSKDGATGQLLNVNADTAAGAIAAGLPAERLVFMTDVPGVQDGGQVVGRLNEAEARDLISRGVIEGGMIPKVEACLHVAHHGGRAIIVDGREEHALLRAVEGNHSGTEAVTGAR